MLGFLLADIGSRLGQILKISENIEKSNVLISHWTQLEFSVLLAQLATKRRWSLKIVIGLLQGGLVPIFVL